MKDINASQQPNQKLFKDNLWKTSVHVSNQKCAHGLSTIGQVFMIFVLVNIRIKEDTS